jgi:D-alanine-D-alanine ligase-like ATP-grasp enzyme
MRALKLAVVFSRKEHTPYQENSSRLIAQQIAACLSDAFATIRIIEYDPSSIDEAMMSFNPDAVFNTVYGFQSPTDQLREEQPDSIARIAALCKCYIGPSPAVQWLVKDKRRLARVLRQRQVGVPREVNVCGERHGDGLNGNGHDARKFITKTRLGSCGHGIAVYGEDQLPALLRSSRSGVMVQEYIDGPEFTVGVVETDAGVMALPPLSIQFTEVFHAPVMVPAHAAWNVEPVHDDKWQLRDLARRLFTMLKLRDCARFDFRIRASEPILLDVNPSPNLDPSASLLPKGAAAQGLSYRELISLIMRSSLRRAYPDGIGCERKTAYEH